MSTPDVLSHLRYLLVCGRAGEQAAEETDSGDFRPGGRLSRAKRRRRMARRKRPVAGAAGLARHRGPYGRASGNDRALGDANELGTAGRLATKQSARFFKSFVNVFAWT